MCPSSGWRTSSAKVPSRTTSDPSTRSTEASHTRCTRPSYLHERTVMRRPLSNCSDIRASQLLFILVAHDIQKHVFEVRRTQQHAPSLVKFHERRQQLRRL